MLLTYSRKFKYLGSNGLCELSKSLDTRLLGFELSEKYIYTEFLGLFGGNKIRISEEIHTY